MRHLVKSFDCVLDSGPNVYRFQAGPGGEIRRPCWTVGRKIASGELAQRPRGAGHRLDPVVEQHVCRLAIARLRAKAADSLEGRKSDQMDWRLAPRIQINADVPETINEFIASQRTVVRKNSTDRSNTASLEIIGQTKLRVARLVTGCKKWSENTEQPAKIVSRHEVKRPAHQPGSGDRSFLAEGAVDVLAPKAKAPRTNAKRGRFEDLRLESADVAKHRLRR